MMRSGGHLEFLLLRSSKVGDVGAHAFGSRVLFLGGFFVWGLCAANVGRPCMHRLRCRSPIDSSMQTQRRGVCRSGWQVSGEGGEFEMRASCRSSPPSPVVLGEGSRFCHDARHQMFCLFTFIHPLPPLPLPLPLIYYQPTWASRFLQILGPLIFVIVLSFPGYPFHPLRKK